LFFFHHILFTIINASIDPRYANEHAFWGRMMRRVYLIKNY
jgi:hypothetical protein